MKSFKEIINELRIADRHITPDFAKHIGDLLDVDWREINLDQLRMGMEHEQEHADVIGNDNPVALAKIALDHLREIPDYYTKLIKAGLD